jgi:hypothetical protein
MKRKKKKVEKDKKEFKVNNTSTMLSLWNKSFQQLSTCFCFHISCNENLISFEKSTWLLDLGNQTRIFLNLILLVSKNESFFGIILTHENSFFSLICLFWFPTQFSIITKRSSGYLQCGKWKLDNCHTLYSSLWSCSHFLTKSRSLWRWSNFKSSFQSCWFVWYDK